MTHEIYQFIFVLFLVVFFGFAMYYFVDSVVGNDNYERVIFVKDFSLLLGTSSVAEGNIQTTSDVQELDYDFKYNVIKASKENKPPIGYFYHKNLDAPYFIGLPGYYNLIARPTKLIIHKTNQYFEIEKDIVDLQRPTYFSCPIIINNELTKIVFDPNQESHPDINVIIADSAKLLSELTQIAEDYQETHTQSSQGVVNQNQEDTISFEVYGTGSTDLADKLDYFTTMLDTELPDIILTLNNHNNPSYMSPFFHIYYNPSTDKQKESLRLACLLANSLQEQYEEVSAIIIPLDTETLTETDYKNFLSFDKSIIIHLDIYNSNPDDQPIIGESITNAIQIY